MWELDYKESWAPKNWCFWTVVLEKTLESPLDCKEIQPVHPKGDQSWVFIGRTDIEAETPILWPPDVKSWLIWKDPDAGKDWGQEKGTTEDEMVGWPSHGFGWTPGVGDGQRVLACWSLWGHKDSDMTEWLNWTELLLTLWPGQIIRERTLYLWGHMSFKERCDCFWLPVLFWFCSLNVLIWANYLMSLNLSVLICNVGIIVTIWPVVRRLWNPTTWECI